ncbi:3-oxoacyl-[acyl-carrier-protein] synthase III C-terminal domain-containing protein [Streptomyces longisporoflavus]|uniref:3-oxoacyl-[acyl-carrier-protein] synthase III C-terminal domain-containing protein n=1 Tax=Streptomyces longisporoflavus TaxID=28044 RepID=A0ABW7QI48_9ACTN
MTAHVSRPQTIVGDHKVTTAEIADDIRSHHPEHPRLGAFLRVIGNCGVHTRYFTRPLDAPTIVGDADIGDRARAAFGDALTMAERAALAALDTAGLAAEDIDAIVTTHTTGWAVPNLDMHLIARLGLRPTVRRIALTTLACPGGTQSLIRAADLVAARPGSKVLVVAAEVISSVYHHSDTGIEAMIYKALFGDSAAATVVSDVPLGPGIAIDDSFEYVLPDSLDRQRGRISPSGFHFDSTKKALTAADDVLPQLMEWVGPQQVDFAVIHPGSPRIISDTTAALGLTPHDARHSTDTLADEGNLGGVSVLRVLERTHAAAPADGARGVMVAFGPGFATAALRCRWQG